MQQPSSSNAEYDAVADSFDDIPQVSEKSTKAELASAYKMLLKKYEDKVRAKRSDQVKKTLDVQTVEKVRGYTVDEILRQMENVKRSMEESFTELSHMLLGEQKRLEDIQRAIVVEESQLKELHDIEAAAVNLEELIRAQEIKKEDFAQEYERMKRAREREEEEYRYTILQQRKREEEFRREREEAFKKREEELRTQENEIKELRKKVESFPEELAQAVEKARREAGDIVKRDLQVQAALVAKEIEGERKVLATRIQFLEDALASSREEVASLKKELDQATRHVQSIAEKAIEGSSGKQTLKAVSEIAMHQAGRTRPLQEERQ